MAFGIVPFAVMICTIAIALKLIKNDIVFEGRKPQGHCAFIAAAFRHLTKILHNCIKLCGFFNLRKLHICVQYLVCDTLSVCDVGIAVFEPSEKVLHL